MRTQSNRGRTSLRLSTHLIKMSNFQTDSLRPSSLPTATLGRRRQLDLDGAGDEDPEDTDGKSEKVAEDWNLRIDREMKAVSTGLKELMGLADVSFVSPFQCSIVRVAIYANVASRSASIDGKILMRRYRLATYQTATMRRSTPCT